MLSDNDINDIEESSGSSDNIGMELILVAREVEPPLGTSVLQQASIGRVLADNQSRLIEHSIYEWYFKNLGYVDTQGVGHLHFLRWDITTYGSTMAKGGPKEHKSRISDCSANLTTLMPLVEALATVEQLGILKGAKKDPSIDRDFPEWELMMKKTARHLSLMVGSFICVLEGKKGNDKKLNCGALYTRYKRVGYAKPTTTQLDDLHKLLVKTIRHTIPSVIDNPPNKPKKDTKKTSKITKGGKSSSSPVRSDNTVSVNGDANNDGNGMFGF